MLATEYETQNKGKEDFNEVYLKSDPHHYYAALGQFDYSIPAEAKPVFQNVIEHLKRVRDKESVRLLDLGCSYGVNSALLKYDFDLDDLYEYYRSREALPQAVARRCDAQFFHQHEASDDLQIVGLDSAKEAVEYAQAADLLNEAIVANLEEETLSGDIKQKLSSLDIIISTGCVGYVTEKTFSHLKPVMKGRPPWVASFVLRMFPYNSIEEVLSDAGLVTEKLKGVLFMQRCFTTEEERRHTLGQLERLGLDSSPEARNNTCYAEFYLSRPPDEIGNPPLSDLVNGPP